MLLVFSYEPSCSTDASQGHQRTWYMPAWPRLWQSLFLAVVAGTLPLPPEDTRATAERLSLLYRRQKSAHTADADRRPRPGEQQSSTERSGAARAERSTSGQPAASVGQCVPMVTAGRCYSRDPFSEWCVAASASRSRLSECPDRC